MYSLVLILYLFFLFLGTSIEMTALSYTGMAYKEIPAFLLANSIMLIYVLVLLALVIYYCRKKQVSLWYFILALVTGLYITGWICGYLNDMLEGLLRKVIAKSVMDDWSGALIAPVVEESIKLLGSLVVVYLIKARRLSEIMAIGIGVGLGFQISEDNSYLLQASTDVNNLYSQLLDRLSNSMVSHWVYTAMLSVAVVIFYRVATKKMPFKPIYILWLATPLVSHFFWNSPLNIYIGEFGLVGAIISSLTLYMAISMYQKAPGIRLKD
ncbi:PrsW family glutamic-type intramembrane protease [Streptococcus sp. zg-JUN1979]|uniref:PrsW family glutamic-type intramembrane protease n=1 Tax=Streptococcus sp. zg-JUN1979 TaxID=3391450 RepID=UPI0039A71CA2